MTSISGRFFSGITKAVVIAPIAAGCNALVGYTYAKLVDLPAGQVAKTCAIWGVAESVLLTFSDAFIQDHSIKNFAKATIYTVSGTIAFQELYKRGFIGKKMLTFLVVMRTLAVIKALSDIFRQPATATQE